MLRVLVGIAYDSQNPTPSINQAMLLQTPWPGPEWRALVDVMLYGKPLLGQVFSSDTDWVYVEPGVYWLDIQKSSKTPDTWEVLSIVAVRPGHPRYESPAHAKSGAYFTQFEEIWKRATNEPRLF